MKRQFRKVAVILFSATLVVLVTGVAWCHFGLMRAERFTRFGLWAESRKSLDFYMLVHPGSDQARLLYAQSLIMDDDLGDMNTAKEALKQLRYIPDDSPKGSEARLQEGRLYLLIQNQPGRAERAFRRSIELNPNSLDAHLLLWEVLDLTGRSHMAEPVVWRAYELSRPEDKVLRLREWFMSQFYPAYASPEFDERFVTPEHPQSDQTEAFRFISFRDSEPDSPLGYVCLARWFQLEGAPEFALERLQEGKGRMKDEEHDPFYLFTLISLLVDMGDNEKADEMFALWPEDQQSGYEYLITRARILHEVRGEFAEAIKAYDEALELWGGTFDWLSHNRKANCLLEMGDTVGAAAARKRADQIEKQVERNETARIRELMAYVDDPNAVMEISGYYKRIGRETEAKCWADHAVALLSASKNKAAAKKDPEPPTR